MKSEIEIQKEIFLLRKALSVIEKCEEMLKDVEEHLGTTYDDSGLIAFRWRIECKIDELSGEGWIVPESITCDWPKFDQVQSTKIRIIDDSI